MNDETFEERLSFRLTRLNVFSLTASILILLITLTIFLIAFTPIREYIPGYTDVSLYRKVYELQNRADSLELSFRQKDLYIQNIRNIIEGKPMIDSIAYVDTTSVNYDSIVLVKSIEDSLLRLDYENQSRYNLYFNEDGDLYGDSDASGGFTFFPPIKGVITNSFSLAESHLGVDIVANKNETVKATLDGTVIFSDWTVETGYVIAIQHQRNFISFYKHNSALLKKTGNYVVAGDPIAIIGESGELTTGPHLHFELWYNGTPVNPKDYMNF